MKYIYRDNFYSGDYNRSLKVEDDKNWKEATRVLEKEG